MLHFALFRIPFLNHLIQQSLLAHFYAHCPEEYKASMRPTFCKRSFASPTGSRLIRWGDGSAGVQEAPPRRGLSRLAWAGEYGGQVRESGEDYRGGCYDAGGCAPPSVLSREDISDVRPNLGEAIPCDVIIFATGFEAVRPSLRLSSPPGHLAGRINIRFM